MDIDATISKAEEFVRVYSFGDRPNFSSDAYVSELDRGARIIQDLLYLVAAKREATRSQSRVGRSPDAQEAGDKG